MDRRAFLAGAAALLAAPLAAEAQAVSESHLTRMLHKQILARIRQVGRHDSHA
jgi:hypothetical protein